MYLFSVYSYHIVLLYLVSPLQFHGVGSVYLLVIVGIASRERVRDDILVIFAEHAAIMRDKYYKSGGDGRQFFLQRGEAWRYLLRRDGLRLDDLLQKLSDPQT